jgi:hypothetical protein
MLRPSVLARALRAAADVLEAAEREHAAESREWVDQGSSPLGRRRHCAAVRRLVATGSPGAAVVGRRHLLAPSTLDAELARASQARRSPSATSTAPTGMRAELERELRAVGTSSGPALAASLGFTRAAGGRR